MYERTLGRSKHRCFIEFSYSGILPQVGCFEHFYRLYHGLLTTDDNAVWFEKRSDKKRASSALITTTSRANVLL